METKVCNSCDGLGVITVLISQHDDETTTIKCNKCNGKKEIHIMSKEEEENYKHNNYGFNR